MYDIIGKIMVYILAAAVMFITPATLLAQKSEQTTQVYANDAVEEFVDKARSTGLITSSSYEEMVNRLDATGVTYDIYITHTKSSVTPYVDESGNSKIGSCYSGTEEYHQKDIYNILYPENPTQTGITSYKLENGDFIKVVVENNTPTLANNLMRMLNPFTPDKTILISKSGYVGNEMGD